MATIVNFKPNNMNISHNKQQNQLTRSLERILEEAHHSGELKLNGRKLKDFPKCAGKYNLNDTVVADLSRNRFCELPEDVTNFAFLETLLIYHNTLRSIPETIRGLSTLSYLDLRSNQITMLPREVCLLPLQVLLVSNNRLMALPDELGRMSNLTELDAACNQITHLPSRINDLKNLKSLSLRSNQLVYLPKEIKYLNLVFLDISCNRITTLPVELRLITTLVNLELSNNPLTSPPASLCVRGLVHVFKYLETANNRDEKSKSGSSYEGHTTLRRSTLPKSSQVNVPENEKTKNLISEWCDKQDKNWLNDVTVDQCNTLLKSNSLTPTGSPVNRRYYDSQSTTPTNFNQRYHSGNEKPNNSTDSSPECDFNADSHKIDEKFKLLGNVQTYREYKEALRQQRNQDSSSVYRPKGQSNDNMSQYPKNLQTTSPTLVNSMQNISGFIQNKSPSADKIATNQNGPCIAYGSTENMEKLDDIVVSKKPIQKVTPSRDTYVMAINGNIEKTNEHVDVYVKPKSPTNSSGGNFYINNVAGTTQSTNKIMPNKNTSKPNRSVSWNREMNTDNLSFTMRREFDKQKEETELIDQLRHIIESRLKMSLPKDITSALSDGVVLCHLANYVRPRSVGSIHVPSPAVPKLTMAKCRRNVDNFLNACRSIGVDDELICSCGDVVPSDDSPSTNYMALYRTVAALQSILIQQAHNTATNTKTAMKNESSSVPDTTNNNYDKYNLDTASVRQTTDQITEEFNGSYDYYAPIEYQKCPPKTLDLSIQFSRKRKKIGSQSKYDNFMLNGIVEETEYDNEINKNDSSEASSKNNFKSFNSSTEYEELISNNITFEYPSFSNENIKYSMSDEKPMNFFNLVIDPKKDDKTLSTILCLTAFIATVIFLVIFQIPC